MKNNHLFKKTAKYIPLNEDKEEGAPEVPQGLLRRCNVCKSAVFVEEVKANSYICPHCSNYFRVPAYKRIRQIADEDSFEEWDMDIPFSNPLRYKGYGEKVRELQEKTKLKEAIVTGKAEIEGMPVVLGVMDGRFLMASMGEIVGEKIARAFERATKECLPVILFACSGGARMQEGIVSLMQMAKTSAAVKRHSEAGLLYISVLTDPTTGGVTASFAMLGDMILAEPGALIGFAGPRVIEQTIRQKLPKGFQRAEFLLEHGFLDMIVPREQMRETLAGLLRLHRLPHAEQLSEGQTGGEPQSVLRNEPDYAPMSAWEHVERARDKKRPVGNDYIERIFTEFVELHGDRYLRDDPAVIGGIAMFRGTPVTVIAQEKGEGTKGNIARNFGMVSPDGYRKSMRLLKQAEKFGRPVIFFVDTPGAFCGMEAEEQGQGEAIARNICELFGVKVPVLSIVIGEGGSGGALAFAVADEVWMLEHAIYSILSPEGFASILWKDGSKAKEAAALMRLTAQDLYQMGIVERVIGESESFSKETMEGVTAELEQRIAEFMQKYGRLGADELLELRYQRFRKF
ncbi:MAG: acetyl-CoA carboxylase, carboxyltransferase subunit beta [Butyrivibrio sp.]|nr:acetyl-CoA carboxylase, carboxyltransferase subunit beta [Muribaculum sp.]MCM1553502.1 acetyl-CoA carboxylase, carboxyltransferase subunit beta [Butyrivibrio sp.]